MRRLFLALFYLLVLFAINIFVFSCYLNLNFWLIGFAAIFTPCIFICILLYLIYWIFKKRYLYVALCLGLFVLGFPFLKKTFIFNPSPKEIPDIKVLSYNVGTFNLKRYNRITDTITPPLMMKWFRENTDADIVCLQEFYNNSISEVENTVEAITNIKKLYYFYTNPIFWDEVKGFFGVITFSRFPIIHSGPLIFGDSSLNRGVYLDLKINEDTVRLINVHMHSMTIRLDTSDTFLPLKIITNTMDIASRLKDGIEKRNAEIKVITEFIKESPHPIILCGDFNDTPYSYTYQKVTEFLVNSFESAGHGFGFTYNRFPWMIRIDNQFYNEKAMKAVSFKIFYDNHFSDHFPIQAGYKFKKEPQ
jgi:endonuclease/exonuclease/phosphatase family metal-dependent hydrolase